jgi:hypothetical protein
VAGGFQQAIAQPRRVYGGDTQCRGESAIARSGLGNFTYYSSLGAGNSAIYLKFTMLAARDRKAGNLHNPGTCPKGLELKVNPFDTDKV